MAHIREDHLTPHDRAYVLAPPSPQNRLSSLQVETASISTNTAPPSPIAPVDQDQDYLDMAPPSSLASSLALGSSSSKSSTTLKSSESKIVSPTHSLHKSFRSHLL